MSVKIDVIYRRAILKSKDGRIKYQTRTCSKFKCPESGVYYRLHGAGSWRLSNDEPVKVGKIVEVKK